MSRMYRTGLPTVVNKVVTRIDPRYPTRSLARRERSSATARFASERAPPLRPRQRASPGLPASGLRRQGLQFRGGGCSKIPSMRITPGFH